MRQSDNNQPTNQGADKMKNQNKKLKNLIKLSCNVKVYIPSTVEINKATDSTEQVDSCLNLLSSFFGGATSYKAIGCWQSKEQGLIKEKVIICESYCKQDALEKNIDQIINFCENVKEEMKQEAISLEVNNELYFI